MIQRIQSVYLLLVAILLVVALCLPVGQFIGPDGIAAHIFKPLGVTLADGNFQSTWGLFGILLLRYSKRVQQLPCNVQGVFPTSSCWEFLLRISSIKYEFDVPFRFYLGNLSPIRVVASYLKTQGSRIHLFC